MKIEIIKLDKDKVLIKSLSFDLINDIKERVNIIEDEEMVSKYFSEIIDQNTLEIDRGYIMSEDEEVKYESTKKLKELLENDDIDFNLEEIHT